MQRLERLVGMISEINKGRYPSVQRFCEMFEVAPRTVHLDIAHLRDFMGYPIEWDNFHKGYKNTDPTKTLPQFELNEGELFALTLGKDMLTEYSGTAFETVLRSAIEKIAERLPEKVRMEFSDLAAVVKFKTSGTAGVKHKLCVDLSKACEMHTVIEMVYFSAHNGQSTFRQVEPYAVVENRGAWYLVAWCRLRNGLRTFALHRITEYKVLNEKFQPREDVDVQAFLDEAFQLEHGDPPQLCLIKFDRGAAVYVRERQWHRSQELTDHEDGSCTLSFTATSLDEVKRWVLTYGASAEVLKPRQLRTMVQTEFERGTALYGMKPAAVPTKKRQAASTAGNGRKRVRASQGND